MSIREISPILVAIEIWASNLANQCIQFHCDNIAVFHVINKNTSKDPILMKLMRRLMVTVLKHNILFRAIHIPGLKNVAAVKICILYLFIVISICTEIKH